MAVRDNVGRRVRPHETQTRTGACSWRPGPIVVCRVDKHCCTSGAPRGQRRPLDLHPNQGLPEEDATGGDYLGRRRIGGYSYRASDVTGTYGRSPPPYLDVRQSPGGPFDSGFFFDSGISPRGGNSPYFH
jgi:hypothetical protein